MTSSHTAFISLLLISLFCFRLLQPNIQLSLCTHPPSPTTPSRGFARQIVLAALSPPPSTAATVGFGLCAWPRVHPGRGDPAGKG